MKAGDLAWSDVPEFGARLAGRDYAPRPGAYAVLLDAERRHIAVVRTPEGWFLPGGGSEVGETLEQTLRREIAEECGLAFGEARPLGRAIEYVFAASENRCFEKDGWFFRAVVERRLDTEPEPDHALMWLTPAEACASLTHESQVWVVRRVLEPPT